MVSAAPRGTVTDMPRKRAMDEPYLFGDRIPTPDAQERDTETAWATFSELEQRHADRFAETAPASVPQPLSSHERGFAPTVPDKLGRASAPKEPPAAPKGPGLAELLLESRRNDRVCPLPGAWQALYQLLPDKRQQGAVWEPAPPITGAAWKATSDVPKRLCLRDHLEWAASHGAAAAVLAYMQGLLEEEWLHQ